MKHTISKPILLLIGLMILVLILACGNIPDSNNNISEPTSDEIVAPPNTSSETTGEQNAVDRAKSYLAYSAFSYEGLIEQLEFEGYTHEEAVYGADNCGADWNEQAVKSAKSYLAYSAFSYDGLIGQLEFEGYTHEEAVYGADNCGADWNEQAAKKAESYLEYSSFSREGLIEQLEFEGFTHEQAVYGVDANYSSDTSSGTTESQTTSNETTGQQNALAQAKSYLAYSAFSYEGLIGQLEFEGYSHEEAVYGADNCGADWNEQAAKKAESYLEYSSFSREGLIEQLEFEGFTHEQAVYGVEANGY